MLRGCLHSLTHSCPPCCRSKENVATIARKAEAKARQASAAAKAKATGAAAPSGSTASGETPPAAAQAVGSLPPAFAGSTLMFGEEEGNGNVEL